MSEAPYQLGDYSQDGLAAAEAVLFTASKGSVERVRPD